jgi:hypothetical protein
LIHREPAVELCGADPYKFAELRELGLTSEQISWKQRFFIPTDETTGVEILSALLARYPVVVAEEAANETEAEMMKASPQMKPTNIVDLEQWIIAAEQANSADETTNEIDSQLEVETLAIETAAEDVRSHEAEEAERFILTPQSATVPWLGQATSATQLAFEFA